MRIHLIILGFVLLFAASVWASYDDNGKLYPEMDMGAPKP